jgi:PIF1-like helicase
MPANTSHLWQAFRQHMSLDFFRHHDDETSYNLALHDIDFILRQQGFSCASFGLPQPTGNVTEAATFNQAEEEAEAERRITTLNPQQLEAFTKIINGIDFPENQKLLYLNGPGGSGKTYLYNTLMSFVRERGELVLAYASTEIAATLMKNGSTIYRGFKLPVPLVESSVSGIKQTSAETETLRQASLIIIDEVTMLPKDGLRCIDLVLRELMQTHVPFGGKVIVIGGDFRQTLPVVPRGKPADVIEACLISSPLWNLFAQLSLISNMRSEGQNEFNQWLLDIGISSLPTVENTPENAVKIPSQMITQNNIVNEIFGDSPQHLSIDDISKRVVLSTTNKEVLEINRNIIEKINGQGRVYYSSDSVVSEDPNDVNIYPAEFLHTQTPSGVPPHVLLLKPGTVVMLIRNLNPKKGLCNGTRMIVRDLHTRFITCEIISESHRGDVVFIPRIDIAPSDSQLPFTLKRRQLPIIPAFAKTKRGDS